MNFQKKRLQLRAETIRTLNPDELDDIQGAGSRPRSEGPVRPSDITCGDPTPWPMPQPGVDPEDTPPGGIPYPPIQFPRYKAALRPGSQPGRSHNGYCTGI